MKNIERGLAVASVSLRERLRSSVIHTFVPAHVRTAAKPLAAFMLVGVISGCASAAEWVPIIGREPVTGPSPESVREATEAKTQLESGIGKYVVVDVDVNELRFMDGERVLWSAPVGTGTGFRLSGEEAEWEFSTPNGLFRVQYKEELPAWYLPDWYFIENDLPIPPENAPERRMEGGLGAAAVFLGHQIAIHGTDKPELLGQRVSHGCIRLSNYHAQRLFHNVQIGTPIVIIGGEDLEPIPLDSVPVPDEEDEGEKEAPRDTLAKYTTEQLLDRLDRQLDSATDSVPLWVATASRLITRGLGDDAIALRGLLVRAGTSGHEAVNREYATFLADAFSRGSLRVVVSLARIDDEARTRAARAIVHATMDLYYGGLDDRRAPWPTRRVPAWRLGPDGTEGLAALGTAEEIYRAEGAASRIVLDAGS